MPLYENARLVRRHLQSLPDGGEVLLHLLHGEAGDLGRKCIHRVHTDQAGRVRSDIVFYYDPGQPEALVETDFLLLSRPGMLQVGQLHHTESLFNRLHRLPRHVQG